MVEATFAWSYRRDYDMRTVDIDEAHQDLARLVDSAADGAGIIIEGRQASGHDRADRGAETNRKKAVWVSPGPISVPDDFDTIFRNEIEKEFYGNNAPIARHPPVCCCGRRSHQRGSRRKRDS
jgi:hypothetical protein